MKKLFAIICCLALSLSFVACGNTTNGDKKPSDGNIPDDNNVTITEPKDEDHSFSLISQNNGTYVYKCADCGKQETLVIAYVSGTKNAYSVVGNTVTFTAVTEASVYNISGKFHGNIVIDATDDYKFELEMSRFEMYSYNECPIGILSGDSVTLSAKKNTENYIFDMRDEVDADGTSASVYAQCDLNVQGKGTLNIKSTQNNGIRTKNDLNIKNLALQVDCMSNALRGDDSVTVESGDLVLIARKGDGIKTTDSDVSKKGNQRGTVSITGGNILIYAACDGIDAAYNVVVNESKAPVSLQVFTDKYSKYSEEVTAVAGSLYYVRFNSTAYKYSLKFYNTESDGVWCNSSSATTVGNYRYYPIEKPSGDYSYVQLFIYNSTQQQGQADDYVACTEGMTVNSNYDTIALQSKGSNITYGWTNYTTATQSRPGGGMGGPGGPGGGFDGNTDKGDYSTKGIKADNVIAISAGDITVSTYDDAIHAAATAELENGESPLGNVAISGGKLTIRSNDDGLHADGEMAISGGTVNIVGSYEGIEGNTVLISGGNTSVVSSDDGVNGTKTSGSSIVISGGRLYVNASGDGVDSNSTSSYDGIHFAGGTCVIISTGRADSSIDTEKGYKYSGGYVIAVCVSGGMSSEATKCSNFASVATSKTLSLTKDNYLVVDGVGTVKMPSSLNALVVCLGKTNANISSASSTSHGLDYNGVYWSVN